MNTHIKLPSHTSNMIVSYSFYSKLSPIQLSPLFYHPQILVIKLYKSTLPNTYNPINHPINFPLPPLNPTPLTAQCHRIPS